jgi:hypothetical protein
MAEACYYWRFTAQVPSDPPESKSTNKMTPIENYCRQYHAQDVLSKGKCDMCGGTNVLASFERPEEEPQISDREARQIETESHTHP